MATSIGSPRKTSASRSGRRRKLALASLLGLMSAALIFTALQGQRSTGASASRVEPATVQVLTAARAIGPDEPLQLDMVALKRLPPDAVLKDALLNPEQVNGTTARFPLSAGEQITPLKLTPAGSNRGLAALVPDGKRAMAINASAVVTAGGVLQPGDRVDVIAVSEQDADDTGSGPRIGSAVSTLLVEDAEVLGVAQRLVELFPPALASDGAAPDERMTKPGEDGAAPDPAASTVTLALTGEEAQTVLLHEQRGLIRLLVRPSSTTAGRQ